MKILAVATPGAGHVNPMMPLIEAFLAQGDEVTVAAGEDPGGVVARAGAELPAGGSRRDGLVRRPSGPRPPRPAGRRARPRAHQPLLRPPPVRRGGRSRHDRRRRRHRQGARAGSRAVRDVRTRRAAGRRGLGRPRCPPPDQPDAPPRGDGAGRRRRVADLAFVRLLHPRLRRGVPGDHDRDHPTLARGAERFHPARPWPCVPRRCLRPGRRTAIPLVCT